MKNQIVFIDRPKRPCKQESAIQQFKADLLKLKEKYGDRDQVIVRAIREAEKIVNEV